jgi:hypothetical protein
MADWASVRRRLGSAGDMLVRLSPLPRTSEGPQSRLGVLLRLAVQLVALVVLIKTVHATFKPIFTVPRPPALRVDGPGDLHLEMDENTRKAIFSELAALEQKTRKDGIERNTWNGHLWSREDDRGWGERMLVRSLASSHHVSVTQVYLVLDEGIRKHWPGPDGNPLPATVPPLDLRTTW